MVHFDSGNTKEAQRCLVKAAKLSQEHSERHWQASSLIWLGRALQDGGTPQNAKGEKYILHGIKVCDNQKMKPISAQGYLFLGELYAHTDQREKALENLGKAQGMFQEMGMDYWLAKTKVVLGRL
jgi:hypothetical protein